jgi:3-oxoadipate enol-lactonase
LNVERTGKGQALIFVHGIGADLNIWKEVVPGLARGHEVVTYDLRGAGQSDFGNTPLSLELWAEDLNSLMNSLGIKRASFAGWSLGGMIALELAFSNPEKVTSLIIVGSTPKLQPAAMKLFEERANFAETAGMEDLLKNTFHTTEEAFASVIRKNHPEKILHFKKMLGSYRKENYAAISRALIKADLNDKLDSIKAPALIVVGQYDIRTPLSDSELMCMKLSKSYMKILPDCGHFYPIEQPELFGQTIEDFLMAVNA